jgi:YD repeat-containing protein
MHYDKAGNLTYYKNEIDSIELNNSYDPAGRLYTIDSSLSGTQHPSYPANLLTNLSFTPAGSIRGMNLGANLNVNRTYDNRLRITSQTVTHP